MHNIWAFLHGLFMARRWPRFSNLWPLIGPVSRIFLRTLKIFDVKEVRRKKMSTKSGITKLILLMAIAGLAVALCIPLTSAGEVPMAKQGGEVEDTQAVDAASAVMVVPPHEHSNDASCAAASYEPAADGAAMAAEPREEQVADAPANEEPEAGAPETGVTDAPVIAVPPQAPLNLNLDYDVGSHTAKLTWSTVVDPNLDRYLVKRWDEGDAYPMLYIFYQLAAMNPAARPYVDDLARQIQLLGQDGWTWTEQMNIMKALAADMDALFGLMVSTPGAGSLLTNVLNQATEFRTTNNYYNDRISSSNSYYAYTVVARNKRGEISNPSNCVGLYAVFADSSTPARPSGVSATAYDPGVGMQWSRNGEADLAGYNVYLVQGQTRIKLNTSLITTGTAFFYDDGVSGAVYGITAVDVAGRESQSTNATAVLAPATVYEENDPAWQFSGFWKSENYVEGGGSVIMVAQEAGARASITFSGRRVKVFSAYYWSCGEIRIYVDGIDYGTRSLYNPSTQWHMQPFVVTGLAQGQHTLVIEVVGAGGAEGYNFGNFDSIEVR
jgi:hypothetical protein